MTEQFNLEKYNRLVAEGKTPKIVTRSGLDVRLICVDRKYPSLPIVALINDSEKEIFAAAYYENGTSPSYSNAFDLIFADLEPTIRPYKDAEECFKDAVKHGGWVKEKDTEFYYHVIRIDADGFCYTGDACESFQDMLNEHVWADDGQPCGRKEDCDA